MRVVIDLQAMQTAGSKNRGIGRYTRSLVKYIVERSGWEVIGLFNGALSSASEIGDYALALGIHADKLKCWHPAADPNGKTPIHPNGTENKWVRFNALLSLRPSVVLATSLFEGLDDCSNSSLTGYEPWPSVCIVYDLIPLKYENEYLADPHTRSWYFSRLGELVSYDYFLAISETTRRDVINFLCVNKNAIVNISGAVPEELAEKDQSCAAVSTPAWIPESYFLYVGGIDYRKNIERLLDAFALFQASVSSTHQLVIVCRATEQEVHRLLRLAEDYGCRPCSVILTGFIEESALKTAYQNADGFIFPSYDEGFGLPVLEAMSFGVPVICSNAGSLQEIVALEEATFDPFDVKSIAASLVRLATDNEFKTRLAQNSKDRRTKFTWARSAVTGIDAIENWAVTRDSPKASRRPSLAVLTPVPPERSGIASYFEFLVPFIARHYAVTVFHSDHIQPTGWVYETLDCKPAHEFKEVAEGFDRILYAFGNSEFHAQMPDLLKEYPGVVDLHDVFLSGLYNHIDTVTGENGFAKQLLAQYGPEALKLDAEGECRLASIYSYCCNLEVTKLALGVIVHSEHAKALISEHLEINNGKHLAVAPLASAVAKRKAENSTADRTLTAAVFGVIAETKLHHRICDCWARSALAERPGCNLILVGDDSSAYAANLREEVRRLGLTNVDFTGWVSKEEYSDLLSKADIAIQLRSLSRGESSAALLDAMAHGISVITNDHGSNHELAGDSAKLLSDDFSDDELISALNGLAELETRRSLGEAAQNRVANMFSPSRVAEMYYQYIEEFYRFRPRLPELSTLDHLARERLLSSVAKAYPFPVSAKPYTRRPEAN